jgi:hypothetical protein
VSGEKEGRKEEFRIQNPEFRRKKREERRNQ